MPKSPGKDGGEDPTDGAEREYQSTNGDRDENDVSQLPVTDGDQYVGSLTEQDLYTILLSKPELKTDSIRSVMGKPFPIVSNDSTIEEISKFLSNGSNAVLVGNGDKAYRIITKQDIIKALS